MQNDGVQCFNLACGNAVGNTHSCLLQMNAIKVGKLKANTQQKKIDTLLNNYNELEF